MFSNTPPVEKKKKQPPSITITYSGSVTQHQQQLVLPVPNFHHIGYLWRLKCFPDIVTRNLFPNSKEVTESVGAVRAALALLHQRNAVATGGVCFAVADGITPRTGALFAFLTTNFKVHSVDPLMGKNDVDFLGVEPKGIRRLNAHKCTLEDLLLLHQEQDNSVKEVVVLAVHSHANLDSYVPTIRQIYPNANVTIVAVECCLVQKLDGFSPNQEYQDWGIQSPKRTVKIWELPAGAQPQVE